MGPAYGPPAPHGPRGWQCSLLINSTAPPARPPDSGAWLSPGGAAGPPAADPIIGRTRMFQKIGVDVVAAAQERGVWARRRVVPVRDTAEAGDAERAAAPKGGWAGRQAFRAGRVSFTVRATHRRRRVRVVSWRRASGRANNAASSQRNKNPETTRTRTLFISIRRGCALLRFYFRRARSYTSFSLGVWPA